MTKYEELCAAFRQDREDSITHRDQAVSFIAQLLKGFCAYIEAPSDRVKFLPPQSQVALTSMGPAQLEEDGWWNGYATVRLAAGPGVYPQLDAQFQFRALIEPDKITVRVGDSKRTHTIPAGDDGKALEPVYKEAFEGAKKFFTGGLQRFHNDDSVKIGF